MPGDASPLPRLNFSGLALWGLGSTLQGLNFKWGLGFSVELGFRVQGLFGLGFGGLGCRAARSHVLHPTSVTGFRRPRPQSLGPHKASPKCRKPLKPPQTPANPKP